MQLSRWNLTLIIDPGLDIVPVSVGTVAILGKNGFSALTYQWIWLSKPPRGTSNNNRAQCTEPRARYYVAKGSRREMVVGFLQGLRLSIKSSIGPNQPCLSAELVSGSSLTWCNYTVSSPIINLLNPSSKLHHASAESPLLCAKLAVWLECNCQLTQIQLFLFCFLSLTLLNILAYWGFTKGDWTSWF